MTARNAVTDAQLGKMFRRWIEVQDRVRGGTLPYDGVMNTLQRIIERDVPTLVRHPVRLMSDYGAGTDIVEEFEQRLPPFGHSLKDFTWKSDKSPFILDDPIILDDPKHLVVLSVTLGDLAQTWEFLYRWMFSKVTKDHGSDQNPPHSSAISDCRDPEGVAFEPLTLKWVVITTDTHKGYSPEWVRHNVANSQITGLETMAAIAQSPKKIASVLGPKFQGWCLASLDVQYGDGVSRVPVIDLGTDSNKELLAGYVRARNMKTGLPYTAFPVIVS